MDMCRYEGASSSSRGMNFRLDGQTSVILMSLRKGRPLPQTGSSSNGQVLIYEGDDVPRTKEGPNL